MIEVERVINLIEVERVINSALRVNFQRDLTLLTQIILLRWSSSMSLFTSIRSRTRSTMSFSSLESPLLRHDRCYAMIFVPNESIWRIILLNLFSKPRESSHSRAERPTSGGLIALKHIFISFEISLNCLY